MINSISPVSTVSGGGTNSLLDSINNFFGDKGAGHFLTTDAFANVIKAGTDINTLFQSHKLFKMQEKMAKEEWAMNKDIYNREKKQEDWRHQLKF